MNRRTLLALLSLAGGMAAAPQALAYSFRNRVARFRRAFPAEPDPAEAEEMVQVIVAGRAPRPGLVELEAPNIAENGNVVPFTVRVNCAMTEAEHPRTVHIFAMLNPFPEVARLHFGPHNGVAEVEMRCRMRQSADLVAVAEMSDGTVGLVRRPVLVTLGACS